MPKTTMNQQLEHVVIKEEPNQIGSEFEKTSEVKADFAAAAFVDEVTIKDEIEIGPTEFIPQYHSTGEVACQSTPLRTLLCKRLRTYGRKGVNSKQSGDLCQVKDEPPRKRPELSPSPELELCELPSSSYPPHLHRVHRLEAVRPTETSLQQQVLQADIEIGSPMEEGAEREVPVAPSTSSACVDVDDKNLHVTLDDLSNVMDYLSDIDMDVDDDTCQNSTVTADYTSAESGVECELTPFEARILATEDRLNDLAVRDITPSDCHDFNWKDDEHTFTGLRDTFTGTTGPTFAVTDQTSVVDVFYRMIDSDFVDRLCTETNRYASQKRDLLKQQNKLLPHSRLRRWSPTDRDEMIRFLALTILQGLYPLPEEESYFSFNGFGTMPYFARIMSYNRYIMLKSMLHFVDNETQTERTKLCKIQPVMDYFNDKFSSLYYPSQEIVVDESLLKWHGRLSFALRVKSKAAKVCVKTYELSDSSNGYLWKFFVYASKQKPIVNDATNDETNDDDNDETNVDDSDTDPLQIGDRTATATIVYNLVKPLLHRGHTLIMDNLYNSPLLARYLKRHNTDCYGTLRLNREFVPESLKNLTTTDLQRGEVVARYCSDLFLMVWRDANLVSMISTYHQLEMGTTQKDNRLTHKPSIVLNYNKSMGGVDRKNHILSAQPLERNRTKVWYKKLFSRMFNVAMYNTYVIYATSNPKLSHRKFRTWLAEDLLKIHGQIDLTTELRLIMIRTGLTATKKLKAPQSRRPHLQHRHFPVLSRNNFSRCWMCSRQKKEKRTKWKCMECNVNLCIGNCFMHYHID